MLFVSHLYKYDLDSSNQCFLKKNLWAKALSYSLGAILIWIISKKSRNNSKIKSSLSAKAPYGSCYKIVASLIWRSKKEWRELLVCFWFQENFPEGGGGPRNPPACLVAAREGARPRIFWIFCRIDMVQRIYRKMKEQSVVSSPRRFRCESPWI